MTRVRKLFTETHRPDDLEPIGANRLAPVVVSRQRVIERADRSDRTVLAAGGLVASILIATAITVSAWALLPLAALGIGIALGPPAIRHGAHPESAELLMSLGVTIAMAVAAGFSGGTSSPIVFLFATGVVMNAVRAGPRPVALCSLVTMVVFLAVSLLNNASAVTSNVLPMLSIFVMQTTVTIASIALANAEISHRRASIVDPLTGLLNRHGLPDRFEELRQQALVSTAPITLVLFDLDHFKRINDLHGHDAGDRLLREVADVIRRTLRRFELVYRVGGEEFLLLLPGLVKQEGQNVAEELRQAIGGLVVGDGIATTASFGVSGAVGREIDFERLYRRADQALYQAKHHGRDRVSVSTR